MPIDREANYPRIAHVLNGEPATEDTFSRPTMALENRTDELRSYLERVEQRVAEDRNIVIDVEGYIHYTSSQTLWWTQPIKLMIPNRSYDLEIGGSQETGVLSDGDVLYADLPYEVSGSSGMPDQGSYANQIIYLEDPGLFKYWDVSGSSWEPWSLAALPMKFVNGALPIDMEHLDSVVVAVVKNDKVYFRNSVITLNPGDAKDLDGTGSIGKSRAIEVSFNGVETSKDIDLSVYNMNAFHTMGKLLDPNDAYSDVDVRFTRPDSDTLRITTTVPLASGTYKLVVTAGDLL